MTQIRIQAVIDNVIRLNRETVQPALLSELKGDLIRENPVYHQIKRMRERNPKYQYIALPPATIENIHQDAHTIYIPRGYKQKLIATALEFDQPIDFFDETVTTERYPIKMADGFELVAYQKQALIKVVMAGSGIFCAPCGGGKTAVGISLITKIAQKTLVLVHTVDLMNQWYKELSLKAQFDFKVGRFGDQNKEDSQIVVCIVQALIKLDRQKITDYLSQFGLLILDECHHCPAATFATIINQSKSRYRYGLTATPKRKDGLDFLMVDIIGPIVSEVTDGDLQDAGRSQSCIVKENYTTFYSRYGADQWAKLINEIIIDCDRNAMIVKNVYKRWQEGHFPLVLSDRVEHCKALCFALKRMGMNAQLLISEIDKLSRKRVIDDCQSQRVDCLIATRIADEGLDIPTLSNIHLTIPSGNESNIKQRIGRIRRPIEGKVCIVDDYIDSRTKTCLRMAKERKKYYKRWGFNFALQHIVGT